MLSLNFKLPVALFIVIFAATMTVHSSVVEPVVDVVFDDGFETQYPVLYPADQVHSPLTTDMVELFNRYFDISGVIQNDVFAKAGASNMVSTSALACFAGNNVDLGTHTGLQGALDHYLAGNAAGSTPFDRSSLAASVGRSASWVVAGEPSPLEQEFATVWPRITLIAFGENDMSLLNPDLFVNSLIDAADYAQTNGSIPVVYSTVPCQACAGGTESVDLYRRLARATAQYRQIPFLDLYFALDPLEGDGLAADGIHMNTYNSTGGEPCNLTSAGLGFGYNMFNLVSLQMLERLRRVLLAGAAAPDTSAVKRTGVGSVTEPVLVTGFPYSDGRNLGRGGKDEITSYSGCTEDGETEGPETIYRLDIEANATLKANLVSLDGADLDMWLFRDNTLAENCITKEHKTLETQVQPGTWYLVIEAFKSGETLKSGEFILSFDLQQ